MNNLFGAFGRILFRVALFRSLSRAPRLLIVAGVIAGALLMAIGNARAQTAMSKPDAYAAAVAAANQNGPAACRTVQGPSSVYGGPKIQDDLANRMFVAGIHCTNPTSANVGSFPYAECPASHPWNPPTATCGTPVTCPQGAVLMANGQCSKTPDQCQDLNGDGFNVQASKPFESRCLANGCKLSMTPGTGSCTVIAGSGPYETRQVCNGEFGFSGETCGAAPPSVYVPGPDTVEEAKQNKAQECVAAGGSLSHCTKANGQHCITSAQGRQLCWNPGETGTKTDGDLAQVRNAGNEAVPPNTNLPSGDKLIKAGDTITTITTNVGGNTTTTVTSTTNYKTENGTDAGPKNQGEKGDGTETPTDDEKGSASGGTDCDSKPIVSDPLFQMVADQTWATRCAVDAGNAADVKGDIGDCKSPFSVQGTNANAVKLRAMRADICGAEERHDAEIEGRKSDVNMLDGLNSSMESEFGTNVFSPGGVAPTINQNWLSFGSGQCPQFSIPVPWGGTWQAPSAFCAIVAAIRALFILAAYLWALRLVSE